MRLHATIAALLIFLFSPGVWALSLGEAQAQSHMNEPLKATITVRAVNNDERDTIRAIIPGAEKFRRAGVRRSDIVERIRVDVTDGQAGDELLIHLSTDERVQEPFVNFLVEVRWLGGSVIREYTLLLDPAPVAQSRQASGSQDVQTSPMSESGQEVPEGWERDDAPVYSPEGETASASAGGGSTYGPVRPQETLWSIAYSQRPDSSITMDQMQLAIYQTNPQAFDGNINQLLKGSMLQIPPANEIRAIDPGYAKREVARQKNRYQPPAPSYSAPEPVSEPEPEPAPEPVEAEAEPEEEAAPAPETVAQAEDEVSAEPVEQQAPEAGDEVQPPAQSPEGEVPPEQASGPATADGEALTQDELMAEGDEDVGTPSVWADEEAPAMEQAEGDEAQAPAGDKDAEPATAEVEAEPVVDEPPQETGPGLIGALNRVTLALGLLLILILLLTYWWYRRRRVTNVGKQFAYAADDEAGEGEPAQASESGDEAEAGVQASPTKVWQDSESVPDSIDEYAAAPLQTGESESEEIAPVATVEVEPEETSPIREMSSEEIDYMGEADVHLAYGLYDEAASVLQRGINENPNRDDLRLKLLEVYHSADQKDEFIHAARDWKNTGVEDEQAWQKAVQLGNRIAPESDLFEAAETQAPQQTAGQTEAEAPQATQTAQLDTQAEASATTAEAPESPAEPERKDEEELEFDLSNFDLGGSETVSDDAPATASTAEESLDLPDDLSSEVDQPDTATSEESADQKQDDTGALDFEAFDMPAGDEAESTAQDETQQPGASTSESAQEDESDMQGLDFDLSDISMDEDSEASAAAEQATGTSEREAPSLEAETSDDLEDALSAISPGAEAGQGDEADSQQAETSATGDFDLGDLNLDEESQDSAQAAPGLGDISEEAPLQAPAADEPISDRPEMDSAGDEEVSVKLDLARAYLDMGEPDMARTLLDEVVEMGNAQQRQEAQDLLTRAS